MNKNYLLLISVFVGLNIFVSDLKAQTPPSKQTVVYSGPSASGDMKRDKGDFTGAIADYTTEITKIDADVQRIVKLKTDYDKMSEFEKANQNQDEVKKNYSDWAKLYYGRAMCNVSLMKKVEATPDLGIAICLNSSFADAYYQRALIINSKDNRENACIDMSKAASLGSEKAKVAFDDNFCWNTAQQHYKDGCSNLTLRKYDEAIVSLNQAIALCTDSGAYYSKRGQAYEGLKKNEQALEDFTKATELSPTNPDGYYQLGVYYFNLENFEKAFDFLTKTITRDPMNYDAYVFRAQCCERKNQQTSAIYDYGQAISLRPSDPEAYYRRALLEREMKDSGKACKDFGRASQLGNPDATEFLKECVK
ncbi:MAG: tetratricopeptide repeat protein [Bacteroidetes bacterium]|nr:tetratricopeptide repeat protein [Bacteroidota bacterium]